MTYQEIITTETNANDLGVQGQKEIKKLRRTVMLAPTLNLPAHEMGQMEPLTPPLSERASGDVNELYCPETEERYESIDLSIAENGPDKFEHSVGEPLSADQSDEVETFH
jgi:hypothetical protein